MFAVSRRFALAFAALAVVAATAAGQDTRTVTEPVFPATCTTLTAQMAIVNGGPASELTPDTTRIQAALTACASGKAVELVGAAGNFAFVSAPLNVPSGVSLIVDGGVTLFASRNREDYQTATISASTDECGTQGPNGNGCKNFILFNNNSTNVGSGIYGYGVIDGRGYATTLKAGADTGISWWTNADSIPSGYSQNNPILMKLSKSTNFTLYKITLRNSPEFHVGWSGTGFTAWGVKIQAPFTAHNTDGIDPQGTNVTVTNSSISDGDDNVAVGASSASANITVSNTTTYSGHGISVGSYTQGGLTNMLVTNVNMAGTGADTNATGIRLKSAMDRGGLLNNITYQNMCLKDMHHILQFTPFYNTNAGTLIPQFSNVTLQNLHFLAPSSGAYAYLVALQGHDATHLSTITMNNVVFDSLTQANTTSTPPEYETFTLAGNVYPSFLTTLTGTNVAYSGSATSVATGGYDCTAASTFPYEVGELFVSTAAATNLQTVSTTNVAGFTLNAMLQPAMATAAYTGTSGAWAGAPAMTKPVNFLEGTTVVGTGTLGANGTLATLTLTGVSPGTHTYTAQYPGDANYGVLNFGSVTVTVTAGAAAATTTSLSATPASATYGASTTLTATVSTALGSPTGTIKFLDGSTPLATVTVASGSATTTQVLGGGSHSLTAVYSGDANYLTSTSAAATVTIATATTTATLTAAPAAVTLGASTTLTVALTKVAAGSTPTGTVNFFEGTTNVGSGSVTTSGSAFVLVSPTTAGAHTYTASYSGDANYSAATSMGVSVTVAQSATTTTLMASAGGSYGTVTTLNASVASASGSTTVPTGSIKFLDGTTTLATVNLAAGAASTTAVLMAGAHSLTAVYSADTNYSASTSAVATVTNTTASTTASVTASPASVVLGGSSNLTVTLATVTGGIAPSGTITILEGTTAVGTGVLSNGATIVSIKPATAGTHSYTASFVGDTNYAATTSAAVTVTATTVSTTTTLLPVGTPLYLGQMVTLTANVTTTTQAIPAGSVTFYNGSTAIGTAVLLNGSVSLSYAATALGSQSFSVAYAGSSPYLASTSAAQVVNVVAPFVMTPASASVSLAAGGSTTVQLPVQGGGSFAGTVSLNCVSPATYVNCSVSPASLSVNGLTTPAPAATVTLSVAATVAGLGRTPFDRPGAWLAMMLPLGLLGLLRRSKGYGKGLLVAACFALFVGGLAGCGTSSSSASSPKLPPAGSQQVVITGVSGSYTTTAAITVVVTN